MSSESKVKFPEQSGDCPPGGSQEMHRKVLTSSTFLCISSASCQLPWSCRFQEQSECLPRARLSFRNNLAIVLGEEVRRSTEKCWKSAVRDSWLPALFCASPRLPASCLDLASSRNTEESDCHFANHWVGPTVLEDSDLQSTSCKQNLQRSGIETMKTQTCCDLVRVLHRCWYRWMWPVAWKGWKRAAAVCSSPTRKGMVSKLPSPQQQPGTWSYYWKSRASMPRGCGRTSLISRRTRWHGDSCQTGRNQREPSWPKRPWNWQNWYEILGSNIRSGTPASAAPTPSIRVQCNGFWQLRMEEAFPTAGSLWTTMKKKQNFVIFVQVQFAMTNCHAKLQWQEWEEVGFKAKVVLDSDVQNCESAVQKALGEALTSFWPQVIVVAIHCPIWCLHSSQSLMKRGNQLTNEDHTPTLKTAEQSTISSFNWCVES